MPLVTWFLIGFFDEVPRDLEEQAMVDGCTQWQAFIKIIIPSVRTGLGAAGLFGFVLSWNDMFYALLLTSGSSRTLPVGIPVIGLPRRRNGANVGGDHFCHHPHDRIVFLRAALPAAWPGGRSDQGLISTKCLRGIQIFTIFTWGKDPYG